VWLSARGSRCCSRNVLLNTLLEDGHGGSVGPLIHLVASSSHRYQTVINSVAREKELLPKSSDFVSVELISPDRSRGAIL